MPLEIIQIVEDDPHHAALIDRALRGARYRTNVATTGTMGLEDIARLKPAMIVLDVMLGDVDGLEVCRRIRRDPALAKTPILMVSALGADAEQRAAGLEAGADDYLAKPFHTRELLSRIDAILRRTQQWADEAVPPAALTVLDRRVLVRYLGRELDLSMEEWRLMQCLAQSPGRVVSVEELMTRLWGDHDIVHDHLLERRAAALSRKLDEGPNRRMILRIPGAGYVLARASGPDLGKQV